MQTKLTLTIDKAVIEQAKKYAQNRHKSVSRIVENYLKNISTGAESADPDLKKNSPITNDIAGMFQKEYHGEDYRQILEKALLEKHL